jgi:hypothetical protein
MKMFSNYNSKFRLTFFCFVYYIQAVVKKIQFKLFKKNSFWPLIRAHFLNYIKISVIYNAVNIMMILQFLLISVTLRSKIIRKMGPNLIWKFFWGNSNACNFGPSKKCRTEYDAENWDKFTSLRIKKMYNNLNEVNWFHYRLQISA